MDYESLTKFDILYTSSPELASLRDMVIERMAKKVECSETQMKSYVKNIPEMYDEFKKGFDAAANFLISFNS